MLAGSLNSGMEVVSGSAHMADFTRMAKAKTSCDPSPATWPRVLQGQMRVTAVDHRRGLGAIPSDQLARTT